MQQGSFMPRGMILPGLILAFGAATACRPGSNTSTSDRQELQESLPTRSLQNRDEDSEPTSGDATRATARASCKQPAYKIVGGQSVIENTQVSSATIKLSIKGTKYCSATLVGPHHVVTAAHCLAEIKDASELKLGSGLDGKILDKLQVEGFKIHPNYKGILADDTGYLDQPFYDVAVITFAGEIPPSLVPAQIALPSELQVGMTTLVSGYGAYGTEDKTRRPLSYVETKLDRISAELNELQLKAGDGRGACYGDSGGPSFIVDSASSCLLLIGSTTGPGRNTDYTCESGGGTLMDLTRYQSWLSCAFKNLNQPLAYLITNQASAGFCDSK